MKYIKKSSSHVTRVLSFIDQSDTNLDPPPDTYLIWRALSITSSKSKAMLSHSIDQRERRAILESATNLWLLVLSILHNKRIIKQA